MSVQTRLEVGRPAQIRRVGGFSSREAEGVPRKGHRGCGGPAIPGGLRPLRRAARDRREAARGAGSRGDGYKI